MPRFLKKGEMHNMFLISLNMAVQEVREAQVPGCSRNWLIERALASAQVSLGGCVFGLIWARSRNGLTGPTFRMLSFHII